MNDTNEEVLLSVENLKKYFEIKGSWFKNKKNYVKAVDGISLSIFKGETLGIVGESGCGKSTFGKNIIRLQESTGGKIYFKDKEITNLNEKKLKDIRKSMQIVFQDPYSSLNPKLTVKDIIEEPLKNYNIYTKIDREQRVEELIKVVGLSKSHLNRYPHEFSGGQRQRIGISRALSLNPDFIVCDESVSALDVSVQSQVINLLQNLQKEFGLTYLFISHDLSVVKHISDRVAVMYLGQVVELSYTDELYDAPLHPYTKALISAIPLSNPKEQKKRERIVLKGDVPSQINPPSGCRFHTRCPIATEFCKYNEPELRQVKKNHWAACHYAEQAE